MLSDACSDSFSSPRKYWMTTLAYCIPHRLLPALLVALGCILSSELHAAESVVAPASTAQLRGLLKAAAEGNAAEVQKLLRAGSNPDVLTEFGETALMLAAKHCYQQNYLDSVTALIKAQINIYAKDQNNHDALWYAASHGNPTCTGLLKAAGLVSDAVQADELSGLLKAVAENNSGQFKKLLVNRALHTRRSSEGKTALMLAAGLGYTNFIPQLIKAGSDIAAVDRAGRSALHHAAESGQLAAVRLLLDAGADISAKNNMGGQALAIAAQKNHLAVVKFLLGRGASVNDRDYHHYTALGAAAINGNPSVARELLARGADPSVRSYTGATLAHSAQFADLAPLQLSPGHQVNSRANNELTPLFGALAANNADVSGNATVIDKAENVRYLLAAGADPNARQSEGDTPLMPAVTHAPELVPALIAHGADVNAVNNSGVSPLMLAAQNTLNNSAMAVLLKAGANPRLLNDGGLGAIHNASAKGNIAALIALKEAGLDLDFPGTNGRTALILAADLDQRAAVDWLLVQGARVDATMKMELHTPLSLALMHGYFPIAERLLKAGANPNHRLANGDSLLLASARRGNQQEMELLLKAGASAVETDAKGSTALAFAAYKGNLRMAEVLLKAGSDPNQANHSGELPIMSAVQNGYVDLVKLLLAKGARTDFRDNQQRTLAHIIPTASADQIYHLLVEKGMPLNEFDILGNTPLHNAIGAGHMEAASSLIKLNAPLDARSQRTGSTPLSIAAEYNRTEAARLLLARGVNIELPNNQGATPLYYAASKGHVGLAQLLLDGGAKVETADRFRQTPLMQAISNKHHAVAVLLLERGANANSLDLRGQTALHLAAQTGDIRTLALLLLAHASVDLQDKYGDSPLILAAGQGNLQVVQRLLEVKANPALRNRSGMDATAAAAGSGHAEILKLLARGQP